MTTLHLSPQEFRRRAAKLTPEVDTQTAILDWLAWMKVRAIRIDTNGQPVFMRKRSDPLMTGRVVLRPCSHVGTPDILVWLPWGAAAIEVKRAGQGKTGLRFSQARWIVETAKLSPLTIIIVAESLADVKMILAEPVNVWRNREGNGLESAGAFIDKYVLSPVAIWRGATACAVELAKARLAKGPS